MRGSRARRPRDPAPPVIRVPGDDRVSSMV
jgi:hypothetical protein